MPKHGSELDAVVVKVTNFSCRFDYNRHVFKWLSK